MLGRIRNARLQFGFDRGIANQLGASVSLLDVLLVLPTVMLIASLPISIGGWGVREAGLAVGFSALGQPASSAVATSLIIGFASLVSGLPALGHGACSRLGTGDSGDFRRSREQPIRRASPPARTETEENAGR